LVHILQRLLAADPTLEHSYLLEKSLANDALVGLLHSTAWKELPVVAETWDAGGT